MSNMTGPQSFLSRQLDRARLKLTLTYLIISGFIVVIFSIAALSAQRYAVGRVLRVLNAREQQAEQQVVAQLLSRRLEEFDTAFKKRLSVVNIVLLVGAGVASYILSGYTLRSIRENVERQEEFAADASHELRTPLATISMEIVALQKTHKHLPKAVDEALSSIQQEVQRMQQIVSGLLLLMRQDQEVKHVIQSTDMTKGVKEAVRQMKTMATEHGLKFVTEFPNTPVFVRISPDHLKQICLILLDNAIKYTPEGEIIVKLQANRRTVTLSVQDAGVGIAAEDVPHIFDRFYRSHSHQVEKGAGLGLTIAKKLVERVKGAIEVKSQLGQGTTFSIRFPRQA
jgi:signal transduction histidine kinase